MNSKYIITTEIKQNGIRVGYITIRMHNAMYFIESHFFGIRIPCDIIKTDDYTLALHKMAILENKYSY